MVYSLFSLVLSFSVPFPFFTCQLVSLNWSFRWKGTTKKGHKENGVEWERGADKERHRRRRSRRRQIMIMWMRAKMSFSISSFFAIITLHAQSQKHTHTHTLLLQLRTLYTVSLAQNGAQSTPPQHNEHKLCSAMLDFSTRKFHFHNLLSQWKNVGAYKLSRK